MESEPVLAPAIVLSEAAIRDRTTSKISLVNIFHSFRSKQLPIKSSFFVTVFISNIRGQFDSLPVTLRILGEKGNELICRDVQLSTSVHVLRNYVVDVIIPIPVVEFRDAGFYEIVVSVEGQVLATRRFLVECAVAKTE
jgi:hypothetical protein